MYPERFQRRAALLLLLIAFWLAVNVSAIHRHRYGEYRSRRDLKHRDHHSLRHSHNDPQYAYPAGSGESNHKNAPMWRYPIEFSTLGANLNALKNSIPRVRGSFSQFLREMKDFIFQMDVVFGIPVRSPSMSLSIPHATDFGYGSTSTTTVHATFTVPHGSPGTGPTPITTPTSPLPAAPTNSPPLDFDAKASDNVVVYYGGSAKTPVDTSEGLLEICKQPAVSIINLAFITGASSHYSYPIFTFGATCSVADTLNIDKTQPLQSCAALGKQIQTCQRKYGKKIFLSLGGATGTLSFKSAAKARDFADALWNAFGPPQTSNLSMPTTSKRAKLPRPFGLNVIVDGFDIDNESHDTEHWIDFARQLRAHFTSAGALATGKTFYLSSAPQCPFPDQSVPLDVLALSDLINIQFYNNDPCDLANGTKGFSASIVQWAQNLRVSSPLSASSSPLGLAPSSLPNATANANTLSSGHPRSTQHVRRKYPGNVAQSSSRRSSSQPSQSPKILIGLPAWVDGGSGFVPAENLTSVVEEARIHLRRAGLVDVLGGIMLWDGSAAVENTKDGTDYLISVTKALAE